MSELEVYINRKKGLPASIAAANFARQKLRNASNNEHVVSLDAQQTLTYPPEYQAYCDQYFGGSRVVPFPLKVNFGLKKMGTVLIVNVRAIAKYGNVAVNKTTLSQWKTHIESAWNIGTLIDGSERLDVRFNLIWVPEGYAGPGEAFELKVHQPPVLTAGQKAAMSRDQVAEYERSGTPHLAQWGLDDRQAIIHEFGHMIGNPDEYFCTSFRDLYQVYNGSTHFNAPFTTDSIMNNTAASGSRIYERHFNCVATIYSNWQGCATPATIKINSVASASDSLIAAMAKRRRAMHMDDDWD